MPLNVPRTVRRRSLRAAVAEPDPVIPETAAFSTGTGERRPLNVSPSATTDSTGQTIATAIDTAVIVCFVVMLIFSPCSTTYSMLQSLVFYHGGLRPHPAGI